MPCRDELPRQNILGVRINAIQMSQALETIDAWIVERQQNYICVTPAHGVMDAYHQPELRKIFNQSGLTTPDGMSIVWLLKLMGHPQTSRVYGPDLMLTTCQHSLSKGYSHYFFGGTPGIANQLVEALQNRFSSLNIAGTCSPPFYTPDPAEDQAIIARINASGADIVWVGISTPKQERWMSEHLGKIQAPVMIGVGAAFDFLSGNKPQAPRWMQRSGLEWLFRLMNEPKRLWKRYAEYPFFILLVAAQLLGIKAYSEME